VPREKGADWGVKQKERAQNQCREMTSDWGESLRGQVSLFADGKLGQRHPQQIKLQG